MSQRRLPPRLYLDPVRGKWVIRDGSRYVRTGCNREDREQADKALADYIADKYEPKTGDSPLIVDILLAYAKEHLPHKSKAAAQNGAYAIRRLTKWWGGMHLLDVTAKACRGYAKGTTQALAYADLTFLRAAINHWHREYGPLPSIPVVVMPPPSPRRERWLTRSEAAKLLKAAKGRQHLVRFILLGLYTGSRPGVILALRWDWIDFDSGIMHRRAPGAPEANNKRTPPVKLGKRILAHLRRWRRLDPRSSLVCHYNGQQINSMHQSWMMAVRRSGLMGKVTPHTLRHTRATWVMQKGVNPFEAAGHLGMSEKILRTVYAKHHPDYQGEAAEV